MSNEPTIRRVELIQGPAGRDGTNGADGTSFTPANDLGNTANAPTVVHITGSNGVIAADPAVSVLGNGRPADLITHVEYRTCLAGVETVVATHIIDDRSLVDCIGTVEVINTANGDSCVGDAFGVFKRWGGSSTPALVGTLPTPVWRATDGAYVATQPTLRMGALSGAVALYLTTATDTKVGATLQLGRRLDPLSTAPTITNFAPASLTQTGGSVTITGTNFVNGLTITVGGVSASNINVGSSTSITCTFPQHAFGQVPVVITNPNLESVSQNFTYASASAPSIASFNPSGIPLAGGPVTITGAAFGANVTVAVGLVNATNINVVNATTITCTFPALAANTYTVTVTNLSDNQSGSRSVAYEAAPSITNFTPSGAPLAGGTMQVNGAGFVAGAGVTVGGVSASSVVVVNATTITCTFPAHAAGLAAVIVTNLDTQASASVNCNYAAAPTITSFSTSPISPAGGAETITGTGFATGATVNVGGTAATSIVVVNATTITCTFPALAANTYTVTVTNLDTQAGTRSINYAVSFDPTAFGNAGDLTFYSRGDLFHLDVNGNVDDTTNVATSPVDSFKNAGAITAHPAKNATGSANSKPSMTFDGVNDQLFTAGALSTFITSSEATILVVAKFATWPTNDSTTSYLNKPIVAVAGGYLTIAARKKAGANPILVGGAYNAGDKYCETATGQVAANTPFLATLVMHGGQLTIQANGNAAGAPVSTGGNLTTLTSVIAMGSNYAGADFANIEIMCLIIYKNGNIANLSTLQQQALDFYQLPGHS